MFFFGPGGRVRRVVRESGCGGYVRVRRGWSASLRGTPDLPSAPSAATSSPGAHDAYSSGGAAASGALFEEKKVKNVLMISFPRFCIPHLYSLSVTANTSRSLKCYYN